LGKLRKRLSGGLFGRGLLSAGECAVVDDDRRRRCVGGSDAGSGSVFAFGVRSEEHTSELQSRFDLVCRLLLEKKNKCPAKSSLGCRRSPRRTPLLGAAFETGRCRREAGPA